MYILVRYEYRVFSGNFDNFDSFDSTTLMSSLNKSKLVEWHSEHGEYELSSDSDVDRAWSNLTDYETIEKIAYLD